MQAGTFFRQHLCSELVSIARLSGRRSIQLLNGNLEEIGEWSALILMQEAVPTGTRVRVKGKYTLKGLVNSCTFHHLLGFFVEIRLDAESRWFEKWFVPEHLFTLCPSLRYFTEATPKVPEKVLPAKPAREEDYVGVANTLTAAYPPRIRSKKHSRPYVSVLRTRSSRIAPRLG
jgi:hypothetical protein